MTHTYTPMICTNDSFDRVDTKQPRDFSLHCGFEDTLPSMPAPLYGHKTGRHMPDPRPHWRRVLPTVAFVSLTLLAISLSSLLK